MAFSTQTYTRRLDLLENYFNSNRAWNSSWTFECRERFRAITDFIDNLLPNPEVLNTPTHYCLPNLRTELNSMEGGVRRTTAFFNILRSVSDEYNQPSTPDANKRACEIFMRSFVNMVRLWFG